MRGLTFSTLLTVGELAVAIKIQLSNEMMIVIQEPTFHFYVLVIQYGYFHLNLIIWFISLRSCWNILEIFPKYLFDLYLTRWSNACNQFIINWSGIGKKNCKFREGIGIDLSDTYNWLQGFLDIYACTSIQAIVYSRLHEYFVKFNFSNVS